MKMEDLFGYGVIFFFFLMIASILVSFWNTPAACVMAIVSFVAMYICGLCLVACKNTYKSDEEFEQEH